MEELWTEVDLELPVERDRSVLVDLVDELAHGEDVVTWFFFWEPELRLRLRWARGSRADAVRERLDRAVADGMIRNWHEEPSEGRRGCPGPRCGRRSAEGLDERQ